MELYDLTFYKYLKKADARLAVQVETIYETTKETINSISGCYGNYTMHDMNHGLRVAKYMEELSCGIDSDFSDRVGRFNAFEIALIIIASLLHDIGMFIRPEDRERIKSNNIPYTSSLTYDGVLKVMGGNEDEAIKEIVRKTHAQRIKEFINYDFNGRTLSTILQLDEKYPFSDDIVNICTAHGENYEYLYGLRTSCTKGNYSYNPQYIAALLRIADYLDLDKQRTPILWYRMMHIEGFSRDEWEKHFVVHNEKKLKNYIGNKLQIFFEGKSSNAKIHRKYLAFIDDLRAELDRADILLNHKDTDPKYLFNISTKVEDRVITEGFKYSDLRLSLDYSSITDLLMGQNIYGDNRLGLRELIQNAIDACELMREIQTQNAFDFLGDVQIAIIVSKEKGFVKIKDSGIGMTIDVVKKHFLNVGKSFYKSNEFLYESYKYNPIGKFGIGFLACFLLSNNVTVKTKYYKNNEVNQIELEKNSEYVVTNTEEIGSFWGTEITLEYSKFFEVFSNFEELVDFINKYFYTSIPIRIRDIDNDMTVACHTNDYNRLILDLDKKAYSSKFEDVNCATYSSSIEGLIRIREGQRKAVETPTHIIDNTVYLFNENEMSFELINDAARIPKGYYNQIRYTKIDDSAYQLIVSTRKRAKGKRDAILSLGKSFSLIIPKRINLLYRKKNEKDYCLTLNDSFIDDIIERSNLPYYPELFEEYEWISQTFIGDGMLIELQPSYLNGDRYYFIANDRENILFYNKGVWVRDIIGFTVLAPYAFDLKAIVNYTGNEVQLDVSRKSIISGEAIIVSEITKVLLNYQIKITDNPDLRRIIELMLQSAEDQ